jgi:hypothetical protein
MEVERPFACGWLIILVHWVCYLVRIKKDYKIQQDLKSYLFI